MNMESRQEAPAPRRTLDRTSWHQPLCTIVVTHHNYSHFVEDALLSILDQTHNRWECVVVDDASKPEERERLEVIIKGLSDRRITLLRNERQLGQIGTFFAGVAATSGEFVTLLDPDDRFAPTYLEEMLKAHLNHAVFCPIVSCDEKLLRMDGALLTGTWKSYRRKPSANEPLHIEVGDAKSRPLLYFSPHAPKWLWTSSSALMMRRAALNFLIPSKQLRYIRSADAYLANGSHFLGGTIFLSSPLVYRGVHTSNGYLSDNIFSVHQKHNRVGWQSRAKECRRDVVESMFHNGVTSWFDEAYLAKVLINHFEGDEAALIGRACPEAYRLWQSNQPRRQPRQLLRRALKRVFPSLSGRRATHASQQMLDREASRERWREASATQPVRARI